MKVSVYNTDDGQNECLCIVAEDGKYITINEKNVEEFDEQNRVFWKEMMCPKDYDTNTLRDADELEKDAWFEAHPKKY